MRILAIRGENLASLAEPFAIEFEAEPLRSAGLFAITGETGAGKSTLLDALCLALYDEFPRVVTPGARDDMPDPSGGAVKENDPRTILRRGAGRGFAEADFVARDGKRYRARCDLMRARGKVTGRLQQRGRALWRIDESGEKIEAVESGVELVNRRIVELTDLTFDQFRRTALLAQGDFDAFLRADARERADLLEKITGAEIYGVLGRRANERWSEAKNALAMLEEQAKGIGVMAPEDRVAITAEMDEIGTQRAAAAGERDEAQLLLRRLDRILQARDRLAQAQAAQAGAVQAWEALAGERRTLADLARAEPLRAPREALHKAESAFLERQDAASRADGQADAARAALEAARSRAQGAADTLAAIEGRIRSLAPLWDEAAALDERIDAQSRETTRSVDAEAKAQAALADKRRAAADARTQREKALAQRDAARADLDSLAPAQPLHERWSDIADQLAKRAQFVAERQASERALREALADTKRAADMRLALESDDRRDRDALSPLSSQIRDRAAALAALDPETAAREQEKLARAQEALQAMAGSAEAHDAAREMAEGAQADAIRLDAEALSHGQELESLRAARDAQAEQREEAERLGELAEAAADSHAMKLRAALEEGAPCPVCGGRDHPFAHSSGAARELVETLRAKRDAARRALAQTDADIVAVSARAAAGRARKDDATRRLEDARSAATRAAGEYAARFAQASDFGVPVDVAGAAAPIAALLQQIGEKRAGLQKIAAAAREMRNEIDRLRRRMDEIRDAIEARGAARAEAEALFHSAGGAQAKFEEKLAGASERIASLDRSLAPYLPICDLGASDLDRDPAGATGVLEKAGARFGAAREASECAGARLAELAPVIAALEAEESAAADRAAAAATEKADRAANLAQLREARAGLLGGEATAVHRARCEAERENARKSHEAARAAEAEAGSLRAASEEVRAVALREVETAQSGLEAARLAFRDALAASGFDELAAAGLLSFTPAEAEAARRLVENAESARRETQIAVEQRGYDLREAEADGVPETPRETLALREAELAQEIDGLATRLGALREKLTQDDEARGRAATLGAEIDAARRDFRIWDDINAAIGSAKGDKFRSFAQSVTLEHLVALANRRLALLSPRYLLERAGEIGSLGLQIVDRDLGDERRSTRSLSGGERFLASLALALALAGLEGRDSFVDTLFIDEGFGALDAATLDVAIDALENLQGQGRKVGVISHVESMQARIATKICVERRGGGVSRVRLRAPGFD